MENSDDEPRGSHRSTCSGCEWLMLGRWAPWCGKAGKPLLFVDGCPCPRERVFYEPLVVTDMVERAKTMGGGEILR